MTVSEATTAADDQESAGMSQATVIAIVYVAAMFISILDTTIVNVALPTLANQFHKPISSIEWVITGYLLSLAVWIPASGWLGDRFGTKRIFLVAVAIFTGASALCGLAQTYPQLIFFRVLQGVGGGMLIPVGLAMLFRAFPPQRRAAAAKILIVPTSIAPASGPVIGGLLIDTASWRWVFLVNVPIGIFALIFGALKLHEHREPAAKGFDLAGFLLAGAGLTLLLLALSVGPTDGWLSPLTLTSAVGGSAALVALASVELRSERPMLQLRLFSDRLFRTTNMVSFCATAAFLGMLFVVPIMLQDVRGASPLRSGLTTFPEAIGVLSMSQVAARLYPKIGPSRLMMSGLTAMSVLLVGLSRIGLHTNDWIIRLNIFALGGSFSFVIMSLQAASFAGISSAQTGQASALYNMQRQVSGAFGVAILASALSAFLPAGTASPAKMIGAYHNVFIVAAVIALVGALLSRLVPDREAAATMIPRRPPALVVG